MTAPIVSQEYARFRGGDLAKAVRILWVNERLTGSGIGRLLLSVAALSTLVAVSGGALLAAGPAEEAALIIEARSALEFWGWSADCYEYEYESQGHMDCPITGGTILARPKCDGYPALRTRAGKQLYWDLCPHSTSRDELSKEQIRMLKFAVDAIESEMRDQNIQLPHPVSYYPVLVKDLKKIVHVGFSVCHSDEETMLIGGGGLSVTIDRDQEMDPEVHIHITDNFQNPCTGYASLIQQVVDPAVPDQRD